jgi:hypothetical protein
MHKHRHRQKRYKYKCDHVCIRAVFNNSDTNAVLGCFVIW